MNDDVANRIGRYELIRRIGSGGMAEIWKARLEGPSGFEKIVAIKKILPQFAANQEFLEMFVSEARLVSGLTHPNIVHVLDFGKTEAEEDDEDVDYFIVMEYVAGRDLGCLLRRYRSTGGRVPLEVAIYITLMAARGLAHAHAHRDSAGNPMGIVHRDVSPSNLLLSYGGEVKVTDFGIAKGAGTLGQTQAGVVKGKLAYMSPEQRKLEPLDARSDIFCLGLVLYELLSGQRLFKGENQMQVYQASADFTGLTDAHMEQLPKVLADSVRHCLEVDPDARYPDAIELEQELATILDVRGMTEARAALARLMQDVFPQRYREEILEDPPEMESEIDAEEPSISSIILVTDMLRLAGILEGGSKDGDDPEPTSERAPDAPAGDADSSDPVDPWPEAGRYVVVHKSSRQVSRMPSPPSKPLPDPFTQTGTHETPDEQVRGGTKVTRAPTQDAAKQPVPDDESPWSRVVQWFQNLFQSSP